MSVTSIFLFLLAIFVQLNQNLNDLDEKVEKVDEKHQGVLWYISVSSLSHFNDYLRVIDNVKAGNKQTAHQVAHAKLIVAIAKKPRRDFVYKHCSKQGRDYSS